MGKPYLTGMLRKIALGLLILVGAVLVIVGAAFGYAQTRLGKSQIAGLVESTLSTPDRQVKVEDLAGFLPFDIKLGSFRMSDAKGAWLDVEGVRLTLSFTDLLRGRIVLGEVGADRVALERLPPSQPAPEPQPSEPFELPQLPELPKSLPALAVDHLYVHALELGAPILGQAATFSLDGSAATKDAGKRLDARLDLERTDQKTASLTLDAGLDLASEALDVALKGRESGGLLAQLTHQPQAGDLALDLTGKGPLTDWKADLDVDAQNLGRLKSHIELGYAELPRLALTGSLITAPGILPQDLEPLLGNDVELAVQLQPTSGDEVALRQLSLEAKGVRLSGSGKAAIGADTVSGTIRLDVPDLAALGALAKARLAGKATAELTASGALMQPKLDLTLKGQGIAYNEIGVGSVETALQALPLASLEQGYAGVTVSGHGTVGGVTLNGEPLRPEDHLTFDLAAKAPAEGEATLDHLTIDGQNATVALSGQIDQKTLAGKARLDAKVPDLAAVMKALGPLAPSLPLAGSVALGADVTVGQQAKQVTADLELTTSGLEGLPAGAAELAGSEPSLTGKVDLAMGEAVTVHNLALKGAGASVTGDARLGLGDKQALGGKVHVAVPSLEPLSKVAGQPLAGSLGADVTLAGTLASPDLTLAAALDKLEAAGRKFDKVTLDATASGPTDKLGGEVRLVTLEPAGSLALTTRYALDGKLLTLSGLSLTGPKTKIGGDVKVDLASLGATGQLKGSVDDLAALEPWSQQAGLTGAIQLQATLATPGGRQDATVHLDAKRIAGSFGSIAGVTLDASAKDLLGKPSVQADARLDTFAQPTLAVDQASVSVSGPITDLQLTASAKGAQEGKPFDVQAKVQAGVLSDRKSVTLQALSGSFQSQAIKLRQPARLVLDKGSVNLDTLDLAVGDAGIRAKGSLEGGRVRADLTLDPSPLSTLAAFGGPAIGGKASGTLTVTGAASAPDAQLHLTVDGLAPAGGFATGGPKPLTVDMRAQLDGGRKLAATVLLQKLKKGPLTVTATLPLRLSLQPFAFDLPTSAPLDARLKGDADLAELASLAELDGQRVAGTLSTDLTLGGTLDAPRVNGTLGIANGLVEDSISGAMLRNIKLQVVGQGDQIVIQQLTAQDRTSGKLTGKGQFQLAGLGLGRLSLSLDLVRARLLDDQYGSATVSGNVGLAGTLQALGVNGKLRIDRADLRIPDRLGSAPPTLDPHQVYAPGMAPSAPKPPPSAPIKIALDIKVDMPEQIFIRGRGLDAEWGGSLRISGTAASPVIVGTIAERRGFLDLLDRRFVLTDSTISFTGAQPPVPELGIKAVAEAPNIKATVQITGPATKPTIELSSEPSMPQDEIISELLFRRDTASITPLQGVQLASAVATLQGGGFDALGKLRSLAGLDTLSVDGSGASDDTSVSAGKYISNKVYLQVQKGMTPDSGKATVEVELTPNISASTNVTETGQSGVSLQWKHDY